MLVLLFSAASLRQFVFVSNNDPDSTTYSTIKSYKENGVYNYLMKDKNSPTKCLVLTFDGPSFNLERISCKEGRTLFDSWGGQWE